jgi:hypothetical protein
MGDHSELGFAWNDGRTERLDSLRILRLHRI